MHPGEAPPHIPTEYLRHISQNKPAARPTAVPEETADHSAPCAWGEGGAKIRNTAPTPPPKGGTSPAEQQPRLGSSSKQPAKKAAFLRYFFINKCRYRTGNGQLPTLRRQVFQPKLLAVDKQAAPHRIQLNGCIVKADNLSDPRHGQVLPFRQGQLVGQLKFRLT